MVDPKKIRLGNIVMFAERYMSVYLISDEQVRCKSIVDDYDLWTKEVASTLSPIPLTEEILIKCGFEKEERKDWDGEPFNVWCLGGIDIHEGNDNTEFNYATYVKGAACSFKGGISVTSLHHLQNIFFALTLSELNVKL